MIKTLLTPLRSVFIALNLMLVCQISFSQCSTPVWSDEFNASAIDLSKWAYQTGNGCPNLCGWGNGELENYTSNSKNIFISNGILNIKAVKEATSGSAFTSSKLVTLGLASWKYGRFEARMRMPLGKGLWPAFWMLSTTNNWPMTGEIDIMEYRGDIPKQTNATLHYGSAWPNNQWDGSSYTATQDLSTDFHIYAVEWEETEIRFYFDKTLIKKETKNPNSLNPQSNGNAWPWNSNFYIILNLAVGGAYTGSPAADQVALTKPNFEIDYVRAYQLPCLTAGIENEEAFSAESVYPLPFQDFLHIIVPVLDKRIKVSIKDLTGRTMEELQITQDHSLNTSKWPSGVYIMEIEKDNEHYSKKILKQ